MVILGLLLILAGAAAVCAALFVSEPGVGGELLGFDVTTLQSFFIGVGAGGAILLGVSILKWGTKRGLVARRERKKLTRLNQKLSEAQAERRHDDDAPPSRDEHL
ncbi:hypothetical protein DDE18_13215 [Nocardioides gansuensis]|uniref:Uncharacterized protein n=1 Tax=Nocardioides gansuensis TaxID=2138300 RepID=A0A2T8F9L3_9ACTN|nr:hypothetical protein [Nocardioides gansuensis]PVG82421.1 hypothetical protein DDE18_13215 [Nocardioides gansuensis]